MPENPPRRPYGPFVPGAVPPAIRDAARDAEDPGPEQELIPEFRRLYAGRPPRLKAADLVPAISEDLVPAAPEPETRAVGQSSADAPAAARAEAESEQSPAEPPPLPSPPAASPLAASKELEQLRRMLEEQKRATLEAIHSTAQLENQLDEARNELSTTKTEVVKARKYAAGPKGGRQSLSSNAAEIATLRASLYQAEQHLEREHQIREHEARQAKIKVKELTGELAAVQEVHAESQPAAASPGRLWRRIAVVVAVAVVAGWGAVVYSQRQTASPAASSAPADSAPVSPPPTDSPAEPSPASAPPPLAAGVITPADIPELAALHRTRKEIGTPAPPSAPPKDFGGAVDRLETALSAFPQPDAVLRAIYKNSKECALVWNDGHPALLFGSDKGGPISLAATVSQCAHAIEQLR